MSSAITPINPTDAAAAGPEAFCSCDESPGTLASITAVVRIESAFRLATACGRRGGGAGGGGEAQHVAPVIHVYRLNPPAASSFPTLVPLLHTHSFATVHTQHQSAMPYLQPHDA